MDARRILAANVRKLMGLDPNLDSQAKVAAASHGKVVQKTVSNVLRASGPAPTLDTLDGLATAFRVPAWTLLHPALGLPLPNGAESDFHRRLEDAMSAIKALRRP